MAKIALRFRWTALFLCVALSACSNPQPGPDKTIGGAVLGAGWGAGAGAVIGNQVTPNNGGAIAVGAGFGALQGALTGASLDLNEGAMLDEERELAALKVENEATGRELDGLQDKLDHAIAVHTAGSVYQVFFDPDVTSLRSGAIADLEIIADSIKTDPHAGKVYVTGHADDSGSPKYNERVSEARARSVAAYLASRGISSDQIVVNSYGSKRPLATNGSPEGRQLNRRVDIYIGK